MTVAAFSSPSPQSPVGSARHALAVQRLNMVDSQVRPSDITDRRIIRAMGAVPREVFVPDELRAIAYMDNAIVLARGVGPRSPTRSLMEPRLYAKLLQLADIPDGGRVLEIGSTTGYGVAVLATMGLTVVGLEEQPDLAAGAADTLASAGITTVKLKFGALIAGVPSEGPYDAIVLAGSVPNVPVALFDQLKTGARLVAVLGTGPGSKATVWTRSARTSDPRDAFDAVAAPLPGFQPAATFVF